MSDKPLISVIVPVYKVERYLPRCIESILGQTYTNFELILVDDGTPDRSGIICDRYAEKDSRIKVIHKENEGVSTARNVGIDAAKGEWITFVDSDDWVTSDCLHTLIKPTFEYNYDFVISSIEIRSLKVVPSLLKTENLVYSKENIEYIVGLITKPRFHGPCAKLYRTEILSSRQIRFPLGIKDGEDKIFVTEYLKYCKSMKTLSNITYFYNRLNECSLTQTFVHVDKLPFWIERYVRAFSEMCDVYGVDNTFKRKIVSNVAAAHLYEYLRKSAKNLKRQKAKSTFVCASEVLLPWINDDYNSNNGQLNDLIRALLKKDTNKVYKTCKKYKLLRKLKQLLRVINIKLMGSRIEKKRDNLD